MAASIYETAATFGGRRSPRRATLASVAIPEVKKRRQPTKHYVYKVVVEWSNGTSTVIYRRYSMFFDFLVKLQELHSSLKEKNPQFQGEGPLQLPELPGKILFGRSHIHQVAEKRRGKIEEFCTALVSLPPEISESSLVLGFFNTWPDDTMQRSYSITGKPSSPSFPATSSSDIIISHPDEMDKLEQYRSITDYKRTNNHQVDLEAGQIVHVIEKHDTGWWMIVTDEEQGYAPAVCLEAVDKTYEDFSQPEAAGPNEVFVAMESYAAENDDEVGFKAGDKIEVVNRNMDGWWKIRKGGKLGYCPAALIRRIIEEADQQQEEQEVIYESAKAIYEGLNIHRPPPRKNTIKRKHFPISQPQPTPSANRSSRSPSSSPEAASHYKVPRPIAHSTSTAREEDRSAHVHPYSTSAPTGALSPNHYEIAPCFTPDDPIYENTEFDDPSSQKDAVLFRPIYQNMEFDGPEKQQQSPHSAAKKAGAESRKMEELDEDYINPEEFKIVGTEVASSTTSNNSTTQKPTTPVKQPPVAAKPANKPKLKGTKSLSVPKDPYGAISDDEYIEMDSVCSPEEEPLHAPVTSSANASPKRTTPNASPAHYGGIRNKIRAPSEGQLTGLPKGRVIERTKSLEDVLAGMSRDQNRKQSPLAERKFRAPIQLGRNAPGSPPPPPHPYTTSNNSTGSDQVDGPRTPITKQSKPEPAKKIAGKKLYHKLNLPPIPDQESRANNPPPLMTPPHYSSAAGMPFSPSAVTRSPLAQAVPKTYIAIEQYQSQGEGCLSFCEGDRCVLVNSVGGWWLVNIGGREGWTPAEFWQADQRAGTVSFAQPPPLPPMRLLQGSKPRSHTVMGALPEPPSQSNHDSFVNSYSGAAGELAQRKRGPPKPKPLSALEESPPLPPPRSSSSGQINGHRTSPTNDYSHLADLRTTTDNEPPWFVGTMEREKAEQFLMENGRQREFLIRERTARRGYYALSIRYHYSVKHFNIDPKINGGYSMGVIQFSSIDDVVKHYQTNSLFVHDGQAVTIGQPVRRKSRSDKSNIQSP